MKDNRVTLNADKCEFSKDRVEFLEFAILSEGEKPLNERVKSISLFPNPQNVTELRRFLGMAQQLSRFCPKVPKSAEPLRGLLSVKNDFLWTENHTNTFNEVKKVLSSPKTL
eukprot:TCONS_00028869-protein